MANEENLKKFQKGTSGNPAGKPVGIKNRSTIARKWLEVMGKTNNPLTGELEQLSYEDLITLAQIKKAKDEADTSAYKAVMDTGYGTPIQQTDITSKGDKIVPPITWVDGNTE